MVSRLLFKFKWRFQVEAARYMHNKFSAHVQILVTCHLFTPYIHKTLSINNGAWNMKQRDSCSIWQITMSREIYRSVCSLYRKHPHGSTNRSKIPQTENLLESNRNSILIFALIKVLGEEVGLYLSFEDRQRLSCSESQVKFIAFQNTEASWCTSLNQDNVSYRSK